MSTDSTSKTSFRSKRSLIRALSSLLLQGFSKTSKEYQNVVRRGYRHGKHNGATPGAFGKNRAKAHRALYVGRV